MNALEKLVNVVLFLFWSRGQISVCGYGLAKVHHIYMFGNHNMKLVTAVR